MEHLIIPDGYRSPLTIRETEVAIKEVKDHFERALAKALHLTRVSAPLFVRPESGLNDNLNGVERPVSFGIREQDEAAAAQGLEELPAIPLHGLRHSCATLLNYLDMNIVDISKYLGHASCSTTMNIYAHSFEEQKRVASRKLDEFLQSNR